MRVFRLITSSGFPALLLLAVGACTQSQPSPSDPPCKHAAAATTVATTPRVAEASVPATRQAEREDFLEVDLKMLGNFFLNPGTGTIDEVPKRYRQLDGQRVHLRGFMYGPEEVGGKRQYWLVYNIAKGNSGGPPLVQERVLVRADKNVPVIDMLTYVEIAGELHVQLMRDLPGGEIRSVFQLDADEAKAVK